MIFRDILHAFSSEEIVCIYASCMQRSAATVDVNKHEQIWRFGLKRDATARREKPFYP